MKEVLVGKKILKVPVLQGGMGVGVSMGSLAGNVALQGGMGSLSTALASHNWPNYKSDPSGTSQLALTEQIQMAKEIANGNGIVAVNAMVAIRDCARSIQTAVAAGVEAVVSGAGVAVNLPEIVNNANVAIAPIVSSGRAATLLCKTWLKRYNRLPDFIVVEGSKAGGHLGFSYEDVVANKTPTLTDIVTEVSQAISPFEKQIGKEIPIFAGGGVFDGADIKEVQNAGAAGAQIATRFIATKECDASQAYKDVIINAKEEDITIVHSPVGMPGRAVHTPLIDKLNNDIRVKSKGCISCLIPCNPATTDFCIMDALVAAVKGDYENGLFFCGSNVGRVNSMTTVKELMDGLKNEWELC